MADLDSISKVGSSKADIYIDKAAYRGARMICKAKAPDLFFGLNQLPRLEGYSSLIVHALLVQLGEIMGPVQAGKKTEDELGRDCESTEACEEKESCEENETCALASVCQSEKVCAGEGEVEGEAGECEKGDDCCEGESVAQRADVCTSVLDHLFSDQATGKAELDALTMVRKAYRLPRSLFDQVVQGMAEQRERVRYQTWGDLIGTLQQTAGASALLMARVNLGGEKASAVLDTDVGRNQIRAWGVALQLIDVICEVGNDVRAGRLMLPVDELGKHGLTEADIKKFAAARSSSGLDSSSSSSQNESQASREVDPRWQAFLLSVGGRILNMLKGASRAMNHLEDRSSRRALAGVTLCYWRRLQRVVSGEVDVFDQPASLSRWGRMRLLPRMARWAIEPDQAMQWLDAE